MNPIIIPCATEEQWHAERAKAIGASEAAALLGESPYMTPLQLWSRKKLALGDNVSETEAMTAGKFLEDGNARWYAHATGRKVVTPQEFYRHTFVAWAGPSVPQPFAVIVRHPTLPLQCTPDRIIMYAKSVAGSQDPVFSDGHDAPGVLQLKNTSAWLEDEWEGEPPLKYQIQVQVEMLCTGMGWGALGAVIGGNKRRDVDVKRHDEFLAKFAEVAVRFWESLKGDVSPAPTAGDLETVKNKFPRSVPGLSCEYPDPEDVFELARVKAQMARLEEDEKALLAKIGSIAGPAETLTSGGRKLATNKSSPRAGYTVASTTQRRFIIATDIKKAAEASLPPHEYPAIAPSAD